MSKETDIDVVLNHGTQPVSWAYRTRVEYRGPVIVLHIKGCGQWLILLNAFKVRRDVYRRTASR